MMQSDVTISPLCPEDLEGILPVEQACFSTPWSRESFLGELQNPCSYYLVARLAGLPVGYGGMQRILGESFITNIAVAPTHRQKGIGRLLLQGLIAAATAHEGESITLEVRPSNQAALGLYTALGFTTVGRRPHFYEHPREDAILMTKYVKEERDETTGD